MRHADIIDRLGGIGAVAKGLGHRNSTTVQGWKQRDSIPDRHKADVLALALEKGIGIGPADFFPTREEAAA